MEDEMVSKGNVPRRVIRWDKLTEYTGLKRTQLDAMRKQKLLNPFTMNPNGRLLVVFEDEVAALQERRAKEGAL
jgi:hypothetical protein